HRTGARLDHATRAGAPQLRPLAVPSERRPRRIHHPRARLGGALTGRRTAALRALGPLPPARRRVAARLPLGRPPTLRRVRPRPGPPRRQRRRTADPHTLNEKRRTRTPTVHVRLPLPGERGQEIRLTSVSWISAPANSFDTGQFCFAASAYSRNVASSIPGTRPCVASSTRVIAKPSPAFSRCTLAVVSIRSGWSPARDSPAESAIEKQPACAAASSSSGFVPCPSSKRDANEYGPSYAPLCIRILPCPSLNVPDHSAVADRTGIRSSPWCSRETFTCTSTRTAYENAGRRPRPSNRGTPAHGGAALVVHAHDVHGTGTHGPRPPGTRKKAGPHTGPAPVSP